MESERTMDNKVGTIDWEACTSCVHYMIEDGGCDSLFDNIERDGDFVVCKDFIKREVKNDR